MDSTRRAPPLDPEEQDLYRRADDPPRDTADEGWRRSFTWALLCVVVPPLVFLAVVLAWAWWPT